MMSTGNVKIGFVLLIYLSLMSCVAHHAQSEADSDQDGVLDSADQVCPHNTVDETFWGVYDDQESPGNPKNQPIKNECHHMGCPVDLDEDGVADYQDRCLATSLSYAITPPECSRHLCVDDQGCVYDLDQDGIADDCITEIPFGE